MSLAALMALSLLASPPAPQPVAHEEAPAADSAAPASSETEDIPTGAPTDDYGFVSWCYGALDEYLNIYVRILPDLKEIDKAFGSPVKEDVPYAKDVALQHKALERFAAAMQAAEKVSPPISAQGQTDVAQGRGIWSKVEAMPSRKLADAWLFWGVPVRCETTAKSLKAHPTEVTASPPAAATDTTAVPVTQ